MEEVKTDSAQTQNALSAHYAQLAKTYGGLSPTGVYSAFSRTMFGAAFTNNPFIQNSRVKGISSRAYQVSKDQVAEYLKTPANNEIGLRQAYSWAETSAYPLFNLRKTYQDVLSYRWYNYPRYADEKDAKRPEFTREWRLTDKICQRLQPSKIAHEIVGQCAAGGKVFYYLRTKVDKPHNSCDYAFLQQLPQDWTKIVGLNNISKYTIMFNLMYFMQPGTDWRQFGDLLEKYIYDMNQFIEYTAPSPYDDAVYASENKPAKRCNINIEAVNAAKKAGTIDPNTDVYMQNGTWFYWVALPVDQVWAFEIDDVSRNVISPFSGLIISAIQQADYEAVQLAILQNPLVSCVLAEMPLRDDADANMADPIKVSPATRAAYDALWYNMLSQNNTSGIGFFAAPYEKMQLAQLQEAPSASDISSKGYQYFIGKSGIGIISASAEPRVGLVNIAAQLAGKFAQTIYGQMENMMNHLYESLNLRFEWGFKMFGDIFSEKETLKAAKEGMTLGILIDTLVYEAIRGHSLNDDLSISNAVIGSDLLAKRLPLISTYSAKSGEGNLPPASGGEPGRPKNDTPQSEGSESDADSYMDGISPEEE